MQSRLVLPNLFAPRESVAISIGLVAQLAVASLASAAIGSGVYQTPPGVSVEERGDRVPGGSRTMPVSAMLTLDLSATPPSLTAVIPNAVLEGGDPFDLTVRSSSGERLSDGTYRFTGDYLRELYPAGAQYEFDWKLSESTNGQVVWNGITGWSGGHFWQVTISKITLVPQAQLSILRMESSMVQLSWPTDFADHVLEYAPGLPAVGWSAVTNNVAVAGGHFSVTVNTDVWVRFYRLRKP